MEAVRHRPVDLAHYLVPGLWGTLKAAAISIVLAARLRAGLRHWPALPVAPVRWVCGVVVEFFRAVPVLIMMFFAFGVYTSNGVFASDLNPLAAVVTALTLYNGSVIAELVRSGVYPLPKGQSRGRAVDRPDARPGAAVASSCPQALTAMLPALVGQFVVILKDTALGYGDHLPRAAQLVQDAGTATPTPSRPTSSWRSSSSSSTTCCPCLPDVERRLNRRGSTAGGASHTHRSRRGPCRHRAPATTQPHLTRHHDEGPGPHGPGPSSVLPRLDSNQQPAD